MYLLLCEGTVDMEFLTKLLINCYNFRRKAVKEDYLDLKLGVRWRKFKVVEGDHEIMISYPPGGGSKTVIKTVRTKSQIKYWLSKNLSKLGIAIDIDERKSVQDLISSIEQSLKSEYGDENITRHGNYSFKCKLNEHEFYITVIPLGDLAISNKLGFDVSQHELEDLILDLAFENEFYSRVLNQAVEFYKEKKDENPNQKPIVKILEAFSSDLDNGIYELISNLFRNFNRDALPDYLLESIDEFLR